MSERNIEGYTSKESPAPMGVGNGAKSSLVVGQSNATENLSILQARRVAMVDGLALDTAATIAGLAYAVAS